MAKQSGIYAIVNKVNFKVYIGSAVDLTRRKNEHFASLRKGIHDNKRLQNAYNKYGEDNFVFDVVETVCTKEELVSREQFWLDFSNSPKIGYNINPTAYSRLGAKCSPESIERIRQALIGRVHSEETKRKIGEGNKGKVLSQEAKNKLSASHKTSEKAKANRARLAEAKKGSKHSEETKKKISEAGSKRTNSEETRRKISESNKGRKVSEESRKKISEAKKAYHASKKKQSNIKEDNNEQVEHV